MTPVEIARIILEQEPKGLHVSDIAQKALQTNLVDQSEFDAFSKKLQSALAQNVKTKEPTFRKTKIGGRKKGCYGLASKLAKPQRIRLEPDEIILDSTNYFGKAGEYAIHSEMLFRGFNASIMTVDEGVDIIASKNNRFFYLQVKTSKDTNGTFVFSIKKASFVANLNGGTFYILVARRIIQRRHLCDYVILPSSHLQHLISKGAITGLNGYTLKLVITDAGQFLLNKGEDVTTFVNRFSLIV
jgi:hypothetical protein